QPIAIWADSTSVEAPSWAVLHQLEIETPRVPDPPKGPPFVHSPFANSQFEVGQSSQSNESLGSRRSKEPFRKCTLPCPPPKRKSRGRQVPNHFVQELAWRCCQLQEIPGFEELEKIDLHEEDEEEAEDLEGDLGVFVIENVEGESP